MQAQKGTGLNGEGTKTGTFAAVPLTSWAKVFHVLEYWIQCPHQEE